MDLVYLGPEGTFSHNAAKSLAPAGARLTPLASIDAVLAALRMGVAERAVLPIENSRIGAIEPVGSAVREGALRVFDEITLDVSFTLYRRRDDEAPLRLVLGHPAALGQTEDWINAARLETREAASNIAALDELAESRAAGAGAIGPPGQADRFGLTAAEERLEGEELVSTRFVLVGRALV